ncbi:MULTISPECIES: DUF4177 domain-containing protein [Salinivibrio]|jgi:hypothetical protein|uniref:DUF4177 domain-containing protein n=3 Tax=Salinivibrio TaxID=51366 RepID=A0AB36K407_9GAMM|nr:MULTISPECIES: DUF4177 domain-containing protein [Salinivibrio]ODP96637.1 DUF4177 domain-containing protein [Salinivibrio sp. BNH]ODQ01143.1 DUF4177 domain-containing protein [Salinivibrio sp. DV]OOE32123.1 DUF4177 domain-containing protein [Salinivibrio kushneri]OOE33203.1 DUF4177 domain-containing protein [Salinivibrio kushneri]OOE41764.1 DUF4177 domain-containing protein [Salinivibrio kushneri]
MSQFTEYKVVHIVEGGCGTLLLGSSGLPLQRLEAELNQYAQDGWQVVFQVIEKKRYMLFWQREAVIVTLGR